MLAPHEVLSGNYATRNLFFLLSVTILINAALSVSLNEPAGVTTEHTAHAINAALNGSVVHSVNRLLPNSPSPLGSHDSFTTGQRNTRTGSGIYKVIRVTTWSIARQNTTLSILAQIAQRDRRKIVQADETGNRVPCLADAVIVNRLDNELDRLRRCGLDAIPNIPNSINSRLEPAPDLIKSAPDSIKNVF